MATFFDLPEEPAPLASDGVFCGRGDLIGCERRPTINSILSMYGPLLPLVVGGGDAISRINHGQAELVAGSVTVPNINITDGSCILLTIRKISGVAGHLDTNNRNIGVSFDITSDDPDDASMVAWMLVEPAA